MSRRLLPVLTLLLIAGLHPAISVAEERVGGGLLVLYDFNEGEGRTIHDRSGVGKPLDLAINDTKKVQWSSGSLLVNSEVLIASPKPATKITDAVKKSNAITVEAWLTPAKATQAGPARIVSISANTSQRNLTLGQDAGAYDVRLRTTERDSNGMPSTSTSKDVAVTRLTHVVFTRDRRGTVAIYVDAKRVRNAKFGGSFGNWDTGHRLGLCNELSNGRPWLGQLHLVAIYNRALNPAEVRSNYSAGANQSRFPLRRS